MRYGIVREAAGLPPANLQRLGLEQAVCDVIIDEGRATDQRRLTKFLMRLRSGDEILAFGVDAFQRSAGELAQLFRHLTASGVVLRLADDGGAFAPLLKAKAARDLIEILAANEDQQHPRPNLQNVRGGSRRPLSRFQIDYARKMYKQGTPLRTIGLIFQLPPSNIWELVSEARS